MNGSKPKRQTMTATLDCGTCHGCCHQWVMIQPDDDTSGLILDHSMPFPALARRKDGACVHLDPLLGCTVYERRPAICRAFHCGLWFRGLPPDLIREIELAGDRHDKDMLRSGRLHAQKNGAP